jgi:vacuolar-type H+-ATPase subunit H
MDNQQGTVQELMGKILEIDKKAVKRLEDVEKEKSNLIKAVKKREEEITNSYRLEAEKLIAEYDTQTKIKLSQEKDTIQKWLYQQTNILEQTHEKRKQNLIKVLYDRVIGGDSEC